MSKDLDMDLVNNFFEFDYHDRGMMKWQGFYLSDHSAALKHHHSEVINKGKSKPKMTRDAIQKVLTKAYKQHHKIMIQLDSVDKDGKRLPLINSWIQGYNDGELLLDGNHFISLNDIRWCKEE